MTTGLKPSWQGLKAPLASSTNPVEEVVGQFVDWRLELDSFNNNQIVFRFGQCQVLTSDVPFPYPDWELSVKFSEHEVSAWGFFGLSAAEALGTSIELLDIDLLKGRWAHVLRTMHDYGPNKEKESSPGVPARMVGAVYRIIRFIQPGEAVASIAPPRVVAPIATPVPVAATPAPVQVAMPAAQVIPAPTQTLTPTVQAPLVNGEVSASAIPSPAPVMVSTPAVAAPVTTVAVPAAAIPATTVAPDITPEDQALLFLHGKDNASFFAAAIPDPIIRTNAELVNSIMSGVFIQAKITSGQVVKNDDGTHSVAGM